MTHPKPTVALIALGCPKNLVDAEYMVDALREDGYCMVDAPADAEAIIVNTCGFIESAKKEAIETILDMAEFKAQGRCRFLIVTGCLAQRYAKEIAEDLPEVDAILGVGAYGTIVETLDALFAPQATRDPGLPLCNDRRGHTTDHFKRHRQASTGRFAYLKIAEGCSNRCSYCAIPGIRGPMVSRPMEDILAEAEDLLAQGKEELILIAQDTTAYGLDRYGERRLSALIRALAALPGDFHLRLLYCYSDGLTEDLLETVSQEPKVHPYLDMPIQHGSDRILALMGRKDRAQGIRETVAHWRAKWPGLVFRSTVMVGFPGETEEDVEALLELLKELRFERVGCFAFSPEEGTKAMSLPDPVPAEVAEARYARVMALQNEISLAYHQSLLGQVLDIALEGVSEDGLFYLGRSYAESPDIDPQIHVLATKTTLDGYGHVLARVVEADAYDLTALTE